MKAAGISWFYTAATLFFIIISQYSLQANVQECVHKPCKLKDDPSKCGNNCACIPDPNKPEHLTEGMCGGYYGPDYYGHDDTAETYNIYDLDEAYSGSLHPYLQQNGIEGPPGASAGILPPQPQAGNLPHQSHESNFSGPPGASSGLLAPQSQQNNFGGAPADYSASDLPETQKTNMAGTAANAGIIMPQSQLQKFGAIPGGSQGSSQLRSQQKDYGGMYGAYPSNYGSHFGRIGVGALAIQGVSSIVNSGLQAYYMRQAMRGSTDYQNNAPIARPASSVSLPPEYEDDKPPPVPERIESLSPSTKRPAPPLPEKIPSNLPKRPAPSLPPNKSPPNLPRRPPPPPPLKGSPSSPPRRPPPPTPPRGSLSTIKKPLQFLTSLRKPSRPSLLSKPPVRPLSTVPRKRLNGLRITWPWSKKG